MNPVKDCLSVERFHEIGGRHFFRNMAPVTLSLVLFLVMNVAISIHSSADERRATSPDSIRTREGFRVELLKSAQADEGSWISMTFDDQGRIIVGLDDRGLARLTVGDQQAQATFERLEQTENLLHVRGVLHAHQSLYVSATNSQSIYRLQDADGDGQYETQNLLQALPYNSRYGHGTNQMTLGPDGMVYVVIGNDVVFPPAMASDSPYRNPQNDWLLPSSHDAGHDDRVGYIAKIDPAGKSWTVVAGGFRNQVDVAFNQHGEMFTWDADMEWDIGLPWYRPTRLNHVVSGGEYGWRWGTGKWPNWFPDSLPSTLDTGLGSPTGLIFGTRGNWPENYRNALFMADWQLGRILMVELVPRGTTYEASSQWFLEGGPLNVCDMEFGDDGALYFITGGRGSQSGLYRVIWTGSDDTKTPTSIDSTKPIVANEDQNSPTARELRQRLEILHRTTDPETLDFIWERLGNDDPWIRFSARIALENQPVTNWRGRLHEGDSTLATQTALMALARIGDPVDQPLIINHTLTQAWSSSSPNTWLLPLRTLQLSLIRQGDVTQSQRQRLIQRLAPLFPQESFAVNWLLQELLVKLKSPDVVPKSIQAIEQATTQEEQFQYAKSLLQVKSGWDVDSATRFAGWLYRSRGFSGGKLVETAWRNARADFEALLSESLRTELAEPLARLNESVPAESLPSQGVRPFVKNWTITELEQDVSQLHPQERSLERGQQALAAANCLRCHRIGERGSPTGPDLTHVGKRFDGRALLESIIDPSRQVDPKYFHASFLMSDGRIVTGRMVGVSKTQLTIEVDPLSGRTEAIDRDEIEASLPVTRSPMPDGLLDTLTRDEILDLIALLRR